MLEVTVIASKPPWRETENAREFSGLIPINNIFRLQTVGVKTNRDDVVYDFDHLKLTTRIQHVIEVFNSEVDRYRRLGRPDDVDNFVTPEINWSRDLKLDLQRGNYAAFSEVKIRRSLYRAFTKKYLFFDRLLNEEVYKNARVFPLPETINRVICCTIDTQMPFSALVTDLTPSHAPGGRPGQTFPLHTYSSDGTEKLENVTDDALVKVRSYFNDQTITQWDLFHYVYGILHHPIYRATFSENLRRELPRIPFAPDFRAFANAGQQLAELHINYEQLSPWPLKGVENPTAPFSWRVQHMRLDKNKTAISINESVTLNDIPHEAFNYRLGNRSALEWVIDQYRVTEDARTDIYSDPNREDDPEYIVRLVGQVVRVSVETDRIIRALPERYC